MRLQILQTRLFILFVLLLSTAASAESESGWTFMPALYYTPDTSVALGASTIYFHRDDPSEKWRTSSFRTAVIYTFRNQWIIQSSPEIFLNEGKIYLRANLGYLDYPENYYGLGPLVPDTFIEPFTVQSERARFAAMHSVGDRHWLGLQLDLFWTTVTQTVSGGEVDSLLSVIGRSHHFAAVGPVYRMDHRDSVFYPTQGHFLETSMMFYEPNLLANSFRYWRASFDLRKYHNLSDDKVIAAQFSVQGVSSGAPFYQLPSIGGSRSIRGYRENRYRGDWSIFTQGEYRRQLSPRWGAAGFVAAGTVLGSAEKEFRLFPAVGAGVRYALDPKEKINARWDIAYWPGNFGFYILIGESF